jgi:hypothetical protein
VAAALDEVQQLQHATAVAAAAPSPAAPPLRDPAAAAAARATDLFGSGQAIFGPALRGGVENSFPAARYTVNIWVLQSKAGCMARVQNKGPMVHNV